MAFDERDYMKESHRKSNEKNLEIYSPEESRPDSQHGQHRTGRNELPKFRQYSEDDKAAVFLIIIAASWILFAAWKILHS